jgi:hypothetical protein
MPHQDLSFSSDDEDTDIDGKKECGHLMIFRLLEGLDRCHRTRIKDKIEERAEELTPVMRMVERRKREAVVGLNFIPQYKRYRTSLS